MRHVYYVRTNYKIQENPTKQHLITSLHERVNVIYGKKILSMHFIQQTKLIRQVQKKQVKIKARKLEN